MFLKNKNIIFKIRRSKVTDYAALKQLFASVGVTVGVIVHIIKINTERECKIYSFEN